MNEPRRVSVILAAQAVVQGRTADDPQARELLGPAIARRLGRILKTDGGTLLAEFNSVTEAVDAAADIQQRLTERNAGIPAERQHTYRIGVNLGEVSGDGDAVHGAGVLAAANLASLAGPGAVALARAASAPIAARFRLEDLDAAAVRVLFDQPAPVPVKAPRQPIRWKWPAAAALAVLLLAAGGYAALERPWEARETPAAPARMAYPLPERPSIGVLAFVNLSGDPQQDTLADGLAENIQASLSKIRDIFVIARNTTFAYKGKGAQIRQVAEDLGIRYVVDGTLKRSGNTLQIDARMTDALSGRHVWTGHYERDLAEIFAVGDQIAMSVVGKAGVTLTKARRDLALHRETDNIEAWLLWRAAEAQRATLSLENLQSARKLLLQALQLDPNYIAAMTALAQGYTAEGRFFPRGNTREMLANAAELLDKAANMDETRAETRAGFANYYISRGELDKALAQAERSIVLDPNDWLNRAQAGLVMHRLNRDTDAIPHLRIAQRLNPGMPNDSTAVLGRAYMAAGQPDAAIAIFESILKRNPAPVDTFTVNAWMAVIYAEKGDDPKAREKLKIAMDTRPDLTVAYFRQNYPYKDIAVTHNRWATVWRKMGMPER